MVANVGQPGKVELRRISGYVRAGGLLVASPADRATPKWWLWSEAVKTRSDRDRDHYEFGNGRIVAYHEPILDPSEFALDVIDLVGVGTRDLRLWNALTVVGLARGEALSKKAVMTCGRKDSDGKYRYVLNRKQIEDTRRLRFLAKPMEGLTIRFDTRKVSIKGDRAEPIT